MACNRMKISKILRTFFSACPQVQNNALCMMTQVSCEPSSASCSILCRFARLPGLGWLVSRRLLDDPDVHAAAQHAAAAAAAVSVNGAVDGASAAQQGLGGRGPGESTSGVAPPRDPARGPPQGSAATAAAAAATAAASMIGRGGEGMRVHEAAVTALCQARSKPLTEDPLNETSYCVRG